MTAWNGKEEGKGGLRHIVVDCVVDQAYPRAATTLGTTKENVRPRLHAEHFGRAIRQEVNDFFLH